MCFREFDYCLWKSAHYKSAFFQNEPPSFLDCVFYHLRDAQKKKNEPGGPVEDQEGPISAREVLSQEIVHCNPSFNTFNATETITVSILFRRLNNTVFLPSREWQYPNSHKLEARSKSQCTVYNRGPRGEANAQLVFFSLVGLVPLHSCAVEAVLSESCPSTRSPSCARLHRQTV